MGAGQPRSLDIAEEWSAIRIPYAPDDADNFVLGLAIDLTCTALPVPNPDPERAPLGPSPLLLVATSDAQLRLFSLARQDRPGDAVAPAQPLPMAAPPLARPVGSAPRAVQAPAQPQPPAGSPQGMAGRVVPVTGDALAAAAAASALPSDDEFDEDEGEGGDEAQGRVSGGSSQGESPAIAGVSAAGDRPPQV